MRKKVRKITNEQIEAMKGSLKTGGKALKMLLEEKEIEINNDLRRFRQFMANRKHKR